MLVVMTWKCLKYCQIIELSTVLWFYGITVNMWCYRSKGGSQLFINICMHAAFIFTFCVPVTYIGVGLGWGTQSESRLLPASHLVRMCEWHVIGSILVPSHSGSFSAPQEKRSEAKLSWLDTWALHAILPCLTSDKASYATQFPRYLTRLVPIPGQLCHMTPWH